MHHPRTATRRRFLSGVLVVGGLTEVGAAVDAVGAAGGAEAAASAPSDAEAIGQLLAAEMLAIAVYEGVLSSGLLSPQPERTARRVIDQERAHVQALRPTLEKLGGTPPPPISGVAAVDRALAARRIAGRISKLRTEHDCVSLLLDLESVVESVYFKAMAKLRSRGVIRLAAQIMANEAQHATAISEARRPGDIWQAVPYAIVEGRH